MEDLTGRDLGPYRVVAALGQGGMARVYKAVQPTINRHVAIKVLSRQFTDDPQFIHRFRHEAAILAQLQHPHILPIFDFGESDGYTFLTMAFIDGGTLATVLNGRPLPLDVCEAVIRQLGDALDYAHSKGIVHRDIKPGNVLLDARRNCLLADFGIALLAEGATRLTMAGSIIGTPEYMSPEQASGEEVGPPSDIYSLGILLYEMLTGRVPFKADTPMGVAFKHVNAPMPSPRVSNAALTPAIEAVVLKALARAPANRFGSALEFAAALTASVHGARELRAMETVIDSPVKHSPTFQGTTAMHAETAPIAKTVEAVPQASRNPRTLSVVFGAVAVLAIAVAFAVWRFASPSPPTAIEPVTTVAQQPPSPALPDTASRDPAAGAASLAAAPPAPAAPAREEQAKQAVSPPTPIPQPSRVEAPPATVRDVALPAAASGSPGTGSTPAPPVCCQLFVDPNRRFSVEYPNGWTPDIIAGAGEAIATFAQPQQEAEIIVERFRMKQSVDPRDYDVIASVEADVLKENQPGITNVSPKVVNDGGRYLVQIDYRRRGRATRQYSIPIGVNLYRITCAASVSGFPRHEDIFKAVVESLAGAGDGRSAGATFADRATGSGRPSMHALATAPAGKSAGWRSFVDPDRRFAIEVPESWSWAMIESSGEAPIVFKAPGSTAAIILERFRLRRPLSPSDITQTLADVEADVLKENQPSATNISAGVEAHGRRRLVRLDYRRPRLGQFRELEAERVRQYSVPAGAELYRITCAAATSQFTSVASTCQFSIDSLLTRDELSAAPAR